MTDTEDHREDPRRIQAAERGACHLISINEAARRGYTKLRLDVWANPDDYIELYIFEGHPGGPKEPPSVGPWVNLWSPSNEIVGHQNPHKIIILQFGDLDDPCWRPLPKSLVRASS